MPSVLFEYTYADQKFILYSAQTKCLFWVSGVDLLKGMKIVNLVK